MHFTFYVTFEVFASSLRDKERILEFTLEDIRGLTYKQTYRTMTDRCLVDLQSVFLQNKKQHIQTVKLCYASKIREIACGSQLQLMQNT